MLRVAEPEFARVENTGLVAGPSTPDLAPRRVLARANAGNRHLCVVRSGVKDQVKNRRAAGGRFAPGVSGNPAGRPRGSRDPRTVVLAQLLDGEGELITRKLIDQAKSGEPWAVRLCIERLLPRHERRISVDLPKVEKAEDVAEAVASVIELTADGQLTIEEARGFLALLDQQRKAIETGELAVRLEVIEAEMKEAKKWD